MDTKNNLTASEDGIVYIKSVLVADLSDEIQKQAGDLERLFAVHRADGEQLALVANRRLAFHLARENDMQPLTVH